MLEGNAQYLYEPDDAMNPSSVQWRTAPYSVVNGTGNNKQYPTPEAFVGDQYVNKGYMTNYAAGYFLVRVSPILDVEGSAPYDLFSSAIGSFKERLGTTGPIQSAVLDRSRVATSNVPLLGDAGPGDVDEAILGRDVPNDKVELPRGMLLAEAFNDGPAYYDESTGFIDLLEGGWNMMDQIRCERGQATTSDCLPPRSASTRAVGDDPTSVDLFYLQDTRDWFAIHSGSCNILMADGSVKNFVDGNNGDGYLNPGFPIPAGEGSTTTTGYVDSEVELPPSQIFNGVFLDDQQFKGRFEDD
jgi:prepilin-type processing-associated H-X9-DG protein